MSTVPALSIKNLTKTYPNGFAALKGIDLEIAEGDFFSLLGPNGAGKSTTISITTGLIKKTAGAVKVFGYDLDTKTNHAKACVGLVPQEVNLSIFEKAEDIVITQAGFYGIKRQQAKARAEYYLKKLDLWDKRHTTVRMLSGGMKRRLMIARALVNEPKLLILDEPTAGVDIEIRRSMWDFLREINQKGTTIILTTHYLEEAENLCHTVALIDQGLVKQQGPMQAFLQTLSLETLILYLDKPLSNIPDLKLYTVRLIGKQTLEVEIQAGQGINEVFALLSQHNIIVSSLKNKTNRLEELFLSLTTKPVGDEYVE